MLMIDGYIVNYNNRNRFYGIDEVHEAMARAVLYDFDINKICDAVDTKWNTNANPTQSGWYLVTIENEVGQRYVAPLYCMEYPYGNFTWEMNKMIGKVIAVQPFPSPYED